MTSEDLSKQLTNRLEDEEFTVFEKARIIGSRALQLAQGAKTLLKISKKDQEVLGFNPIDIAKREFEEGIIPISIHRTMPVPMKRV